MADKRVRLKPHDPAKDQLLRTFTHGGQKFVNGTWYRVSTGQADQLARKRQGQSGDTRRDIRTPMAFDVIEDSKEALEQFEEEERLEEIRRIEELGGETVRDGVVVAKSAASVPDDELDGITAPAAAPTTGTAPDGKSTIDVSEEDVADLDEDNEATPVSDDESPVASPVPVAEKAPVKPKRGRRARK